MTGRGNRRAARHLAIASTHAILLALSMSAPARADAAPSGRWDFEVASSPEIPTTGLPLAIRGPVRPIDGPTDTDRAIRISKGAWLGIAHGLSAPVDEYTLVMDLRLPTDGTWRSLFQTDPRNASDGDCFVKPDGSVGVAATGYSAPALFAGRWHRLVVSVRNGSAHDLHLDGRRILTGIALPKGGRFSLADTLLVAADDDGETDSIDLASLALHSRFLDASEVQALGAASPAATAITAGPWLQAATDTSISILWESATSMPGWVEYGTTPALGSRTEATLLSLDSRTNIQRARLGGLHGATTYHYRAASELFRSPPRTFRTAPSDRSARIRFGVWGDSHQLHPAKEMFAYLVDSLQVDFAVTTGDISNDGNDPSDLRTIFVPLALESIGSRVPFFAALGNHDVGNLLRPRIRSYLDQPRGRNSDPSSYDGSYVAAWGPVALVALDWSRLGSDIPGWLETQLESDFVKQFPFVFAFLHRAPFYERWQAAGENARLREAYPPVVEGHGVQASFSGHMHGYERGYRNGTFYCTTGGASYLDVSEPVGTDYPFITVGAFEATPANFGLVQEFMVVEVDGSEAVARMHAFDGQGRHLGVLDSFRMAPRPVSLRQPAGSSDLRISLRGRRLRASHGASVRHPVELRLLEARGREAIRQATGSGEVSLDLGGLPAGCFVAQARTSSHSHARSICLP